MIHSKDDLARKIIESKGKLRENRSNFEIVWEQISEFVLPNRGDFTFDRAKGARADYRVFDTTAIQANEMLASTLHSGLTNPASKWFTLTPRDPVLADSEAVKRWVEQVTNVMYSTLNSTVSNFYQQNHELLLDLVAYGTACMYIDEEVGSGIRCNTRHLSELDILENSKGVIDSVYRSFKFTARQASQEWGEESLGPQVRTALANEPNKQFDFIHKVLPYKEAQKMAPFVVAGIPENRKFVSIYVCEDDKCIVGDIAGFYEMPYIVVRWEKLIGEVYGRSPAWNSLSDIRMINVMSETLIRAAQKQVDPPLLVADDGVIMPMRTHPSGTNVGGLSQDGTPLIAPLQTGGRLDIGLEMMEQRRDAIRQAYFVDQFIPKQGTPVTATENIDNQETRLRLTGPQVNRTNSEYLTRVIDRIFALHQRAGHFPEPPEDLDGVELEVEYISPLVKQQRIPELQAVNRAIASMAPVIDLKPEVLDNLNADKQFRDSMEIAGVKLSNTLPEDDVKTIRDQRAEQAQAAQQQEALVQAAESAAKLASAGVEV
jgi:hypothetical protein